MIIRETNFFSLGRLKHLKKNKVFLGKQLKRDVDQGKSSAI